MHRAVILVSLVIWTLALGHTAWAWMAYHTLTSTLPIGFYPGSLIHIALTAISPLFFACSFKHSLIAR